MSGKHAKTNAQRQREKRDRRKREGFVYKAFLIKPEWESKIKELIEKLRGK